MNGKLKLLSGLAIALIIAYVIRAIVLGGATGVNLSPAPKLSGAASQAFSNVSKSVQLPVAGEDFKLKNIHYFDNKQWVVVSIQPINQSFDPGILVMKKVNGAYQGVLGPGSQFSSSYTYTLPKDVWEYLLAQGEIRE